MKKHKFKTLTLKSLNILPSRIGYFLYHNIQSHSFQNFQNFIGPNTNSLNHIIRLLSKNGIQLKHKHVLEIGSGWHPVLPFLLKTKAQIDSIHTYDLNFHYQQKNLDKCYNYFKKEHNYSPTLIEQHKLKLPDFIHYYPNTNIIDSNLPKNIDIVLSRFALEHVSPSDLLAMHKALYANTPQNTNIIHLISPSDHRAYSDKTLSVYDFLKYSKEEWKRIQTKFDYHNRLRLPDYLDIFEQAGFKVSFLEFEKIDTSSPKYKAFKKLHIHEDFKKYSEEELLAGSINVLLQK
ncbi:hypothetical protein [Aestuariibaculum sediminum]|uniref:Methyltransferase domain-containing protein n=1 Tax=Aestuariibaculum sediminum TaxID=2770637 RepID=A0A8J6U686_9FLAO|nr:hypothetical protein [Aestuariibaculum sediminum]MBD0830535.1 hypothetical protein [Aestuariibaculum sediminum]